jgi:hypothetical protein
LFAIEFREMKSGTQRTQSFTEDTEKKHWDPLARTAVEDTKATLPLGMQMSETLESLGYSRRPLSRAVLCVLPGFLCPLCSFFA